jgi:CHAT domain-containing protein
MTRFYTLRSKNPTMTKGEAFHRAQLSLVRGEKIESLGVTKSPATATTGQGNRAEGFAAGTRANLPLFKKDPQRPFAHPFYWAPFVLIGNWR